MRLFKTRICLSMSNSNPRRRPSDTKKEMGSGEWGVKKKTHRRIEEVEVVEVEIECSAAGRGVGWSMVHGPFVF